MLSQDGFCTEENYDVIRSDMIAGIDFGGSKTAVSLADNDANIFYSDRIPTACCLDFSENLRDTAALIDSMLKKNKLCRRDLSAIGIVCPGTLDLAEGRIVKTNTIEWRNIPVRRMFEEEFKVPVALENDAAGAAYAECLRGAGRGCKNLLYYTVSTGVGGGVVINKKIYEGTRGFAAEFGHISVNADGPLCRCGSHGCVQLYSSGTAIAAAAKRRVDSGENSSLSSLESISALDVEKAYRANDALARAVWDDAMQKLGMAAGLMFQAFDPEVIVFGGGVSNAWDIMESTILSSAKRFVYADNADKVRIKKAELGALIGTTGAVLLARDLMEKTKC